MNDGETWKRSSGGYDDRSRGQLLDGVQPMQACGGKATTQRPSIGSIRGTKTPYKGWDSINPVGVIPMDENRISGAAKNLGGKMEEGVGRATGDAKTRVQGQARQVEGSVQDLYGQAIDSAEDAIDAVRQMPASVDDTIRHYIESNPYTTAAIALGLGWLIGRSHRPF
jgi:uncharacterized protein YjbJ (UPF0337 family)